MPSDKPKVIYAKPCFTGKVLTSDFRVLETTKATKKPSKSYTEAYAPIPEGIEPDDAVVVSRSKLTGLIAAEEMDSVVVVDKTTIDTLTADQQNLIDTVAACLKAAGLDIDSPDGGEAECAKYGTKPSHYIKGRIDEQQAEVKRLREMLAVAYSGRAKLYGDDGHLTDSTEDPWIDYRRDSVDQIQAKITKRGQNAIAAAIKARKEDRQ